MAGAISSNPNAIPHPSSSSRCQSPRKPATSRGHPPHDRGSIAPPPRRPRSPPGVLLPGATASTSLATERHHVDLHPPGPTASSSRSAAAASCPLPRLPLFLNPDLLVAGRRRSSPEGLRRPGDVAQHPPCVDQYEMEQLNPQASL